MTQSFTAHSIVQHVSSSLARAPYNLDTVGTYQATALSARDRLIKSEFNRLFTVILTTLNPFFADWNDTQSETADLSFH